MVDGKLQDDAELVADRFNKYFLFVVDYIYCEIDHKSDSDVSSVIEACFPSGCEASSMFLDPVSDRDIV